jgi:hypothetical protein
MNNKYDEILDRLKKINPAPMSDKKLTDSILQNIEAVAGKKKKYFTLNVNDKQWSIINGVRILIASAAVYLTGYLVFQQWKINTKVERLEKSLVTFPYEPNLNIYGPLKDEKIQKALNELQLTNGALSNSKTKTEKSIIKRKSLKYLLNVIHQSKIENESFREKLRKSLKANDHQ